MFSNLPDWRKVIGRRFIYLDNDALVSLDAYGNLAASLEELSKLSQGLLIINPIYLEFLNVNSEKERAQRSQIISNSSIETTPMAPKNFTNAIELQRSLPIKGCSPSPTDLYLGTCVLYDNNDRCILTGNIKDFPMPIFKRLAHMVIEKDNSVRVLSFLTINKDRYSIM